MSSSTIYLGSTNLSRRHPSWRFSKIRGSPMSYRTLISSSSNQFSYVKRSTSTALSKVWNPSYYASHKHNALGDEGLFSEELDKLDNLDLDGQTVEKVPPKGLYQINTLLDSVKWDEKGLAVAIAQNVDTGAILMQAFVNRDALAATLNSRKATFYSRSRASLWVKGETSSNFIDVHDVYLDCDRDSIIYLGKPDGPSCHTGAETCYFTSVNDTVSKAEGEGDKLALTTLYSLESTVAQRKAETGGGPNGKPSWTKKLLLDEKLLCSKIREEADELCRTLEENEDKNRAASEMADVLYHSMVLLANKGVKMEEVLAILRARFSQSGVEEKKSRSVKH